MAAASPRQIMVADAGRLMGLSAKGRSSGVTTTSVVSFKGVGAPTSYTSSMNQAVQPEGGAGTRAA